MIRIEEKTFEPAIFSDEELAFLLDHITETPVVALHKGVPAGVNPVAIQRILSELQELRQLEEAHGVKWAGFEPVIDSINRYLIWRERSQEIHRRTGGNRSNTSIANPSQYAWDSSGRAFKYGIDSDSAEMVRTEILADGSRRPFGVKLLQPDGQVMPTLEDIAPWVRTSGSKAALTDSMIVKQDPKKSTGSITCSICDHTETFDSASRSAFTMARGRMKKHMQRARSEVGRHRLLMRKNFESPTNRT